MNNYVFNLVNLLGYIKRDSHERNAFDELSAKLISITYIMQVLTYGLTD